jgi:hypothetical protein
VNGDEASAGAGASREASGMLRRIGPR